MARYLHSSIAHLEAIEQLLQHTGHTEHAVTTWHRELAERAKVPPPELGTAVGRWLRSLPNSDANRVIDTLQSEPEGATHAHQ